MPALSLTIEYNGAGVITGLKQIGDEGEKAMTRLTKAGQQGNVVLTQIEKQHSRISEAAKKSGEAQAQAFERAEASGKFFNEFLGVRLPRSVENVMAKSQGLQSVLAGAFNVGLVAIFAKTILDFIPEIDKMTKAWGGFSEEQQAAYEAAKKQNLEILAAPSNLSNAKENLKTVNDTIKSKTELIEMLEKEDAVTRVVFAYNSDIKKADAERNQLIAARETLMQNTAKLEQESLARQLQLANAAGAAGLHGAAAIAQDKRGSINLLQLAANQGKISPEELSNSIALVTLKAQRDLADLSKAAAQDTQQMVFQVAQIGMPSIIAAHVAALAEIAKINAAADRTEISQEEAARRRKLVLLQEEKQGDLIREQAALQTSDMQLKAASYGAKGEAAIRAELQQTLAQIDDREKKSGLILQDQRVAAEDLANKKIAELRKQASEQIVVADQRAALAIVPEWQRANLQIVYDHANQVRAIQQQLADKVLNQQEADRMILDADQEMNGRIIDNHRQAVQQMADAMDQFAQDLGSGNIGKRLLDNFRKLTLMMVAQYVSSFSSIKNGTPNLLMGLLLGGNYLNNAGMAMMSSATTGSVSTTGMGTAAMGLPALAMLGGGSTALFGGSSLGTSMMGFGGLGATMSSTSSLTDANVPIGGSLTPSMMAALTPGGSSSSGGVGSFLGATGMQSMFTGKGLASLGRSLGPMAAALLGSKFGGLSGTIGGGLAATLLMSSGFGATGGGIGAAGNSIAGWLSSTLGISSGVAAGLLGGAAGGAIGFGVGSQYGKTAGSLSGAGSGALVGALIGGPVGALLGGLIGLFGGLFGGIFGGSKRKKQANAIGDQVESDLRKLEDEYKGFQIDYASALSQLDQVKSSSWDALKQLKGEGKSVYNKRLLPDFDRTRKDIEGIEAERTRRQGLVFSPPMFHSGGLVDGAAGMMVGYRTGPGETLALLRKGEFVVEPGATQKNLQTLQNINAGSPFSGGDIHVHVHTMDPKSMKSWLRDGGAKEIRNSLVGLSMEGK